MNTKEPFIITISREVGSGGHTVGRLLANQLGVPYCDKMLLESLQKQFGLSAAEIEKLKGKKKHWLADFMNKVTPMPSASALGLDPRYTQDHRVQVTSDELYRAEVEVLREFASMGSCVVAGRSGFFVFKDCPNILNVFITASLPHRVKRVCKKQGLNEADALDLIKSIDQARENFIQRYAGVSRYDARNYHLVLNADGHTEDQLAALILSYIK